MAPKKAASLLGLEELTNNKNGLGKALVAEAIGVFFINYFGCLSCLNAGSQSLNFTVTGIGGQLNNATFTSNSVQFSSQTVATALSFGLIVFAMVQVSTDCKQYFFVTRKCRTDWGERTGYSIKSLIPTCISLIFEI